MFTNYFKIQLLFCFIFVVQAASSDIIRQRIDELEQKQAKLQGDLERRVSNEQQLSSMTLAVGELQKKLRDVLLVYFAFQL